MAVKQADAVPAVSTEEIAEQAYVILHHGVGNWYQGQTVTATDLGANPVQIRRLLRLQAITEVGTRDATDTLAKFTEESTTPAGTPVLGTLVKPEDRDDLNLDPRDPALATGSPTAAVAQAEGKPTGA